MKKAAATLSNGISATSAQAGNERWGVLTDSPPRSYGEGPGVGRRAAATDLEKFNPTAKSPTPDPSPQEAGRGEGAGASR